LDREESTPAAEVEHAAPGGRPRDPLLDPLPDPRADEAVAAVLAAGTFAATYLPWARFDGRRADGGENTAAFDGACAAVAREMSRVEFTELALYLVPEDAASLRVYARAHDRDKGDPWTATLWAIEQASAGRGRRWPPSMYDPCWCGRPALYSDCCQPRADRR
jgi:hypothetical protein